MSDVDATPTRFLIRDDYERRGCFSWNKPRFMRLCAKFRETPVELSERIGIACPSVLQRRFENGFTHPEGILLTLFEETLDKIKTGAIGHD